MKKALKIVFSILFCFLFFILAFNLYDRYFKDDIGSFTKDVIENYKNFGNKIEKQENEKFEDSGITGDSYNFNAKMYPYYGMLNNNQKYIYKQVYANYVGFATFFVPIKEINYVDLEQVFSAIFNDHPELFYVTTEYSYKYYETGIVAQVELKYNELKEDYDNIKKQIDDVVNSIVNFANIYETSFEKEVFVHNYLIDMIEYVEDSEYNQSIYSALILKKSVCAGYARSFQYIMSLLEIPTYYVEGSSEIEHAWNIVLLDNQYYNVDLTWDDGNRKYKYFNKTDMEFSATHERVNMSLKLPNCFGYTYKVDDEGNLIN